MSTTNFFNGQPVRVIADHNQFQASAGITYHVGSINRVSGLISVQLLHNGRSVGAIDERKLTPAK